LAGDNLNFRPLSFFFFYLPELAKLTPHSFLPFQPSGAPPCLLPLFLLYLLLLPLKGVRNKRRDSLFSPTKSGSLTALSLHGHHVNGEDEIEGMASPLSLFFEPCDVGRGRVWVIIVFMSSSLPFFPSLLRAGS